MIIIHQPQTNHDTFISTVSVNSRQPLEYSLISSCILILRIYVLMWSYAPLSHSHGIYLIYQQLYYPLCLNWYIFFSNELRNPCCVLKHLNETITFRTGAPYFYCSVRIPFGNSLLIQLCEINASRTDHHF